MDIETFSEVAFVHDRFGTDWQYFDDRTLEVFAASDAQIDLGNRATRTVQTRMSGYLSTRLALATQGLTQSTVGQLDLTDKTTDLVGYLRSVISDQNLRVGEEFAPNVFAFGPDVHEMLIKLDQVREAGANLGTAYPQVGVVEGAGAGVAPAVQRVCQAIGLTAVLVGSSYIDTTGNPAWTFSKDSTCVVTSHGLEDYSALKTYTPYDELINVIVSEVTAPNDPGWAWRADAEMALEIQDPNLGRKLNVKIA